MAEQGVRRRCHGRAERGVIDDATDLTGLLAERDLLELSAHVFPRRREQRGAEDVRADKLFLDRLAVDLVRDQRLQDEGALRMADQHDAATLVVVLQVVLPRIADVVVLNALAEQRQRIGIGRQRRLQAAERDLPVHRREGAALRCEARELLQDDVLLRRILAHARGSAGCA